MPMEASEIEELKKLLQKARQKAIAFGLCLGKKPENTFLYLDLVKSTEVLVRNAKKAADTAKTIGGKCEISGKIITLHSDAEEVPPGSAKSLKKFFVGLGMPLRVVILSPSGAEADADGDEAEAEEGETRQVSGEGSPAEEQVAPEGQPDPLEAQWRAVDKALGPAVAKFAASENPKAKAVQSAWDGADQAAQKGDFKGAIAVAAKLKPIVTAPQAQAEAPSATTETPEAKAWAKLRPAMETLYTNAMGRNPENRGQLTSAWGVATEKAEAGDHKGALAIAAKLKPLLEKAASAQETGAEQDIPKDVVAFQKSRILWSNTRSKMNSELAKLQAAILEFCNKDPELAEVAEEAKKLPERLGVFDTRLETILDQITETPEGDARTRLKQAASAAVKDYQGALNDGFFKDVDKENGFVPVDIASSAVKSLESISRVLNA